MVSKESKNQSKEMELQLKHLGLSEADINFLNNKT